MAVAATAGSVRGAWGADAGPGVGVVGTVEAWRTVEREKAAPDVRILHCDEVIELRGEASVEARGRVRDESCVLLVVMSCSTGRVYTHITALLLVKPGRTASDGL